MGTNPVIDARDLVAELFPQARWAVLNGNMRPSAGSDLDIMVLLPDGDLRACRNDARRFRGRPVELFMHDEQSLDSQIAWELAARKPFLYRIVTTGATIAGDPAAWSGRCTANRGRLSAPAGRRPSRRGVLLSPARPGASGRRRRQFKRWACVHSGLWRSATQP